jgi:hypothetical protein
MAGLDVLRGLFNKDGEQGEETPPAGNDERSAFIRAQMAEGETLQSAEDLWREKAVRGGRGLAASGSSILSGRPITGKKEAEYAYLPSQVPQGPEEGINPFKLENIVNKVAPLPPKEEVKTEAPKPTKEAAPAAQEEPSEGVEPPKTPSQLTALQDEIARMEESYGKHGVALKQESDALMSQLADARASYDESIKLARTDYEEAKARQQWAQVAEIIGRSLVGLVAAKRSIEKGRDFTQGLDPRSQVDWLGQLRESRADLQERIDAARRDYEGRAQVAGEAHKGRKAELETTFEGKQKGFGERIRELRQAEGRQYEEGQKAEQRAWQEGRDKARTGEQFDAATKLEAGQNVRAASAKVNEANKSLQTIATNLMGKKSAEAQKELEAKLIEWGMNPEEANTLIQKEENFFGTKTDPAGVQRIVQIARGLPGYPKLLSPKAELARIKGSISESQATEGEQQQSVPPQEAAPVEITSKEDFDKLPSGARFSWKGKVGRKP